MTNDNILYIPIQINGGEDVPKDLLERELYIKNGELYVGTGDGEFKRVIGNVVPGATIEQPTLVGPIKIDENVIYNSIDEIKGTEPNVLYLIDEGNF